MFSPFTPYLRSPGSAPFGAGATPLRGAVGRIRDWGIGTVTRAVFDPPARPPEWLADIDQPIVLVTTSSVRLADERLVQAAVEALSEEPVHVVATVPSGAGKTTCTRDRVTYAEFVPHSLILDRAVCVVTHGGMGVTQKALNRGIPVCAVPFGRDCGRR